MFISDEDRPRAACRTSCLIALEPGLQDDDRERGLRLGRERERCDCGARGAGLPRAGALGRAAAGKVNPACPVLRHLIPSGDTERSLGTASCVLHVSH